MRRNSFLIFALFTLLGILPKTALTGPSTAESEPEDPQALAPFLRTYCVVCHDSIDPKGSFDLEALIDSSGLSNANSTAPDFSEDLFDWRLVRDQLRHRVMPPASHDGPRPDEGEIGVALSLLDRHLASALAALPQEPGTVTARRLNRREYRATVRDLLGIDLPIETLLPPDEVGDGFDHIGDVLLLPPMLFEKYVGLAEEIARDAVMVPGTPRIPERREPPENLQRRGGGRLIPGDSQWLYSRGTVSLVHRFPRRGTYRFEVGAYGQQAGNQSVRLELTVGGERKKIFEVPEVRSAPGTKSIEVTVDRGVHEVGVTFINDYYRPNHPDRNQRDRNAAVRSLAVIGPLEGLEPTAFQRSFWEEEPPAERWRETLEPKLGEWLTRAWRRPATPEQIDEILDLVARATPAGASAAAHLQTAIVATLVSPRFLFRLEQERDHNTGPGEVRPLDGYERATRLSYFLTGSTPDASLLAAAAVGELDTLEGVRSHAARLFASPAGHALSEAFVPQWLQFSHLPEHRPDPKQFPEMNEALRKSLGRETVEFFDFIRREGRPVKELIEGDYSVVNQSLASFYGLEGVAGENWRAVPITSPRGGGLLAQAGILTVTSSPTRTSPVMRGKWLLEALLDAPPPPAPPGAGTLPEPGQPGSDASLREQMEAHRRAPECANCHVRMDALGFALEQFDAIGRWRPTLSENPMSLENPIDARGTLPDGRVVDGVGDLRKLISEDRGFLRALAKNLFVFALGRGATEDDEPAIERLIARLEREPTIAALVDEIVTLEAFLNRRVPTPAPSRSDLPREEF